MCIESAPFASITQIGRRPHRPRGAAVCDGMRSVCGSGGGMGIECVPFASLGGGCVQNRACLRVLRELGGGLVGLMGLSFVMECTPEVPWV